jgi:hypothetical protein
MAGAPHHRDSIGFVMARVKDLELLNSMRACLQQLESVKLLNPADLELVYFRRTLRHKIAVLQERDLSHEDFETAAEVEGEEMFDATFV